MTHKLYIIFSTLAGICFISGVTILKHSGAVIMERLERILAMLDRTLSSRKKRHIAGGILLSVSLLFGGIGLYGHDIETR